MPAWGWGPGTGILLFPLILSGLGLAGVYWHCPPPEMRVRPLQVEKPGSGCVATVAKFYRLQNFWELRWGFTAVLGKGEVSLP